MTSTLPTHPAFQEGVRLFNAGQWWHAHEAWEEPWHAASGDDRAALQGLILLAAALHKRWAHGSETHRNYHKALRHLGTLPPVYAGVNLLALQADVWAALHDAALRPQVTVCAPPGGPDNSGH